MNYKQLESIVSEGNPQICLFGAGDIGKSIGYYFISGCGIHIDFYADNAKEAGCEIMPGIFTIDLQNLYALKENVVVFITVDRRHHKSIEEQLISNGITKIIKFDIKFRNDILISVANAKDKNVMQRYNNVLDDYEWMKHRHTYYSDEKIDIEQPKTFNEKIQWLKLNYRNDTYTHLVDKYDVKDYVAKIIGEKYVIPTLGVWEHYDDIKFDELPNQFVLKCTHDSGSTKIIFDKSQINHNELREEMEHKLSLNYYWIGSREWPYKNVIPRIIAEPYLVDESGYELKDYKVFSFNGIPRLIQVDWGRFAEHKRNLYDTEWNYIDLQIKYPTDSTHHIEKPDVLDELLHISKILSKGMPFVRLDFYIIEKQIKFGEFTFFHGGGSEKITPEEWRRTMGEWIELPNKRI